MVEVHSQRVAMSCTCSIESSSVGPARRKRGSAVAFDVGVLLRLARLDVFDPDALLLRPRQQRAANVLGPVIAANRSRFATAPDDLFQRPNHADRR
jgi:hypothetical protein